MAEAYVVDASVAFEYLLKTSLGLSITSELESSELFAPELMDAEVLSAVRRSVLRGELDSNRAVIALTDLIDLPVIRVPLRSVVLQAWEHYQNATAYDALYVATADQLGIPMLTADARLARAAGLGIDVVNIRTS